MRHQAPGAPALTARRGQGRTELDGAVAGRGRCGGRPVRPHGCATAGRLFEKAGHEVDAVQVGVLCLLVSGLGGDGNCILSTPVYVDTDPADKAVDRTAMCTWLLSCMTRYTRLVCPQPATLLRLLDSEEGSAWPHLQQRKRLRRGRDNEQRPVPPAAEDVDSSDSDCEDEGDNLPAEHSSSAAGEGEDEGDEADEATLWGYQIGELLEEGGLGDGSEASRWEWRAGWGAPCSVVCV